MSSVNNHLRITTCVHPDAFILNYVDQIINDIKSYSGTTYEVITRKKHTIKQLFETSDARLLVVLHTGIVLYTNANNKIFYHENTTRVKLKAYEKQDYTPPLIQLVKDGRESPNVIIDATCGMANDLILMARVFPDCTFYAFEYDFFIHFAIKWGVWFHYREINKQLSLIDSIQFIYGSVTAHPNLFNAAQIVYLDPMYEQTIETSNIATLANFVDNSEEANQHLLDEIMNSFQGRLILRAHYKSPLFHKYPFEKVIQKRSKTHFGYIDLKKEIHKKER